MPDPFTPKLQFDFEDPMIREMVEFNHQPKEKWVAYGGQLLAIICETCHESWPCPTIVKLRAWKEWKEQFRDQI